MGIRRVAHGEERSGTAITGDCPITLGAGPAGPSPKCRSAAPRADATALLRHSLALLVERESRCTGEDVVGGEKRRSDVAS